MVLKKIWRREDGSVAVIAAVAFTLIIALCGLVIDLGTAYMQGSVSQTAADAAALAAGTLLPVSADDNAKIQQIKSTAADYAVKNGVPADNVEAVDMEDISGGRCYGVRVRLKTDVSYGFGPILGINGTTVSKSAKVTLKPASSSTAVVPLGIEQTRLQELLAANQTQHLVIKYGGGGGTEGFFGALDLDGVKGGGAKDFESWLAFGYDGILRIGDVLPVEPGNMAGPTTEAFTTRYSQCTHYAGGGGCTLEHFDPDCPRVVTLIVYSLVDSHTVKVKGFVPFILEGTNSKGEIVASKITFQTQQGESEGVIGGTGDYGIYRIRLVE
ncbi:MAG: pilus assembly protein TadG-related protein [Bacillota bacterium]